jgi:hypothetical protein
VRCKPATARGVTTCPGLTGSVQDRED